MVDTTQDPLRTFMSMAEDLRSNVDSMISQGTKSIQASLPALPGFPGGGKAPTGSKGIGDILSRLPKIPNLPALPGTEAAETKKTTTTSRPSMAGRPTTPAGEGYKLRNAFQATGYRLRA